MSDYAEEVREMTYEQCMKELEAIVSELKNGERDLESSIASFERAVVLRNRCREILDESERRIETIMRTSNGVVTHPFDCE